MSKRPQATSEQAIKHAKPEARPYKMGAGQGMYLLVNPAGSKLWRLKYRFGGKEKTLSFGAYPAVGLRNARLKRAQARQQLADGIDPSELAKERKREEEAQQLTFRLVAERWYKGKAELAARPWAASTADKARLYLEKDIYPAIGDKPIADITRVELIALNEAIERRGAFDVATKVRQWLGAIFDEAFDRGEIQSNPAQRLKPSHRATGAETKHHPFVPFSELPEVLAAVEDTGSHRLVKLAVRFLVLTGVRPQELRFATWQEFDLEAATWRIPPERMKMRRAHIVPLPRQALELLEEVQAISSSDSYLFCTRTNGKPISENTINKALRLAGYKDRQTGHGFRHLLSTELNERGYNSDWIETQLAHIGKNKIRATYNHADYVEQRRQMVQEWADLVDAAERGANVVAFKKQA